MRMRTRWICTLAAAAAVLFAGRADAFNIVFNGPSGFGVDAATAASAEAAGVPILDVAALSTAASLGLQIPAPEVLSFHIETPPTLANPNTATSQWNVTNGGAGNLPGTWLVFLTPQTYTPSLVGFEISGSDQWALFDVVSSGTDYFYPAKFLGNLDTDETASFLMHHRVAEPLDQNGQGQFVLPKYQVAALQGLPIPEPSLLVLVAAGCALAASLNRRNA
jgi:hypothetical protein